MVVIKLIFEMWIHDTLFNDASNLFLVRCNELDKIILIEQSNQGNEQ